jgi:hypothetical protein
LLHLADDRGNFRGGLGRALRQLAHFIGHHGKASAHFTGPGGFDGRIQRQQIGLFGNFLDDVHHRGHRLAVLTQAGYLAAWRMDSETAVMPLTVARMTCPP